jgi:hypothetical protein
MDFFLLMEEAVELPERGAELEPNIVEVNVK